VQNISITEKDIILHSKETLAWSKQSLIHTYCHSIIINIKTKHSQYVTIAQACQRFGRTNIGGRGSYRHLSPLYHYKNDPHALHKITI
jgi:hypothetical protein